MDQEEAAHANALVAVVGETRPAVSPSQVVQLLSQQYSVESFDVQVKRDSHADFLMAFSSRQLADQVLHTPPPPGAALHLVFQRWRCQAGALFKPFRCKVLLVVSNIPTHMWSVEVMQSILGLFYPIFDSSPCPIFQLRKEVMWWMNGLKFSDGYAFGLRRCVNMTIEKLIRLKSHDYHIIMKYSYMLCFKAILMMQCGWC
jgi:hypothetical protein